MSRTALLWNTVGFGLLTAVIWALIALEAALEDRELSTNALMVWVALIVTGCVLGLILPLVTAWRRARHRGEVGPAPVDYLGNTLVLLMALAVISIGTERIFDASEGWWGLVGSSLIGGFGLGLALRNAAGNRHRVTEVRPTTRDDG